MSHKETSNKTQLGKVFCHSWFNTGHDGVEEIYLVADGKGPMGFYDRVHVIFDDTPDLIFPAHHCEQMELVQ